MHLSQTLHAASKDLRASILASASGGSSSCVHFPQAAAALGPGAAAGSSTDDVSRVSGRVYAELW